MTHATALVAVVLSFAHVDASSNTSCPTYQTNESTRDGSILGVFLSLTGHTGMQTLHHIEPKSQSPPVVVAQLATRHLRGNQRLAPRGSP
jgi:hypothetical protein